MAVPEIGRLIHIDPAELMRDNPAALIVNHKSYELMEGYFSPVQMDPPQVLRVATFSADKGEVIRLFVKDGMTRTKFADDHRDVILPEYPDFRFTPITVRDVTESELRNPLVVPLSERREGQTALTMLQYLRSVVPPTVEHSEIAPDRIAAHLINGWINMVGPELSNKFSALAAISMLDNPNVPIATDAMLRKFLQSQKKIIPEEVPQERAILQDGLAEMASIIKQTRLLRRRIAESAFVLVSAGSDVIGGERQAIKQIYGLLNTVEANKKLEGAFPQVSERERNKSALGNAIVRTLSQLPPDANPSQILSLINQSLRDPNLSFTHIFNIFSSAIPLESYKQVRLDINAERLKSNYSAHYRRDQLSTIEEQLIGNLGRVDYLPDEEIRRVAWLVKNVDEILREAVVFKESINKRREDFQENGVNPVLIKETLEALEFVQSGLLSATSHTVARRKLQELKEVLSEKKRKISYQVDMYKIGQIADEVYGDELQKGQGALIRSNISLCILREVGNSELSKVKPALELLKNLPSELQLLVIKGEMRLKVAQQRSRAESVKPEAKPAIKPSHEDAIPVRGAVPTIAKEPQPDAPILPQESIDQKVIEAQRIEINNQKLAKTIKDFNIIMYSLDLDLKDLSSENLSASHDLLRRFGQYLFNHPDIVRAMKDYPRLLEEINKLRSAKVQKEQSGL